MAFTGQLGTANSRLGNIELGAVPAAASASGQQATAQGVTTGPPDPRAPWFRLRAVPLSVQPSAAPPALVAGPVVPGFTTGPRVGVPWHPGPLISPYAYPSPPPPPPAPDTAKSYVPPFAVGPMIGSPYFKSYPPPPVVIGRAPPPPLPDTANSYVPPFTSGPTVGAPFFHPAPVALPSFPAGGVTPPTPVPVNPVAFLGTLARDPDLPPRLRRDMEILSSAWNSLLGGGYIQQTGVSTYRLVGGAFTMPRDPGTIDDSTVGAHVGAAWVNVTAKTVWFCVQASVGSAIWKGPF